MNIQSLVKEINSSKLTIEELRILNQLVVRHIKAQRKSEALNNAATLTEGMVVRINHPKMEGRTGKIIKIKRTKCDIDITGLGRYTVPMGIVQAL